MLSAVWVRRATYRFFDLLGPVAVHDLEDVLLLLGQATTKEAASLLVLVHKVVCVVARRKVRIVLLVLALVLDACPFGLSQFGLSALCLFVVGPERLASGRIPLAFVHRGGWQRRELREPAHLP